MRIINGRAFINGSFEERSVFIEDGKFAEDAGGDTIDAGGCYVIPGLVDIHTHGAMGCDFCSPQRSDFDIITEYYLKNGTTTVLATSMTMDTQELESIYKALGSYNNDGGARVLGIHMEGPFFSYGKRGAQPAAYLQSPDIKLFNRLNTASGGAIRLAAVAPELPGALEFIEAASKYCKVSLGHTEAGYDQAIAGFEAGADHVTHLFNGMNSFLHREPGVCGAAFDSGAYVELVCDGFHVLPPVIRATFKMFGSGKVCIISDSLSCAGLPDGEYNLAGQDVTVNNGKATLKSGSIAGSSINMLTALRNLVSYGIGLPDAILACTKTPAKSAGISDSVGAIENGLFGDCLILEKDLSIRHIIKGGSPM